MKTYTGLRTLFGTLTNNTSASNLTLGDELINDSHRRTCSERDWDFLQKSATASTVASTQFYNLPYDYDSLIDVTVTIGTMQYVPVEAKSKIDWDLLNETTNFTSNTPEYYFIYNGQIGFWPIPASSTSNAITYNYRRKVVDLSIADYATGTVDVITNASTTVTGSGTSWNASMIGKFLRVTPSATATSNGDGFWYEITAVASATSLTIKKAYQGTSLTTGASAAYIIGQTPFVPEPYHDMLVYDAASVFYSSINPDATRAELFSAKAGDLLKKLRADHGNKTTDPSIHDAKQRAILNPNLFITI